MIKVMVVDDDKLVRKGLIAALPWSEFDMKVVAEANNGVNALEVLNTTDIDLILLDLSMPVMTGIELMKAARQKYPRLLFVILTLHQDFEYVQEALRLGAIDYVAKVQLEKERFEEILGRIHERILEERKKVTLTDLQQKANLPFHTDTGFLLISKDEQPGVEWIYRSVQSQYWNPYEIDGGLWLWTAESHLEQGVLGQIESVLLNEVKLRNNWMLIKLIGLEGENKSVIYRLLRRYWHNEFFYEFDFQRKSMIKTVKELESSKSDVVEEEYSLVQEQWNSFKWIYDDLFFEQLLDGLKMLKLPVTKLMQTLVRLETEWNRVYHTVFSFTVKIPEPVRIWQDIEEWLKMIRKNIIDISARQSYSKEVNECIMKAIKIMHEEISSHVFAVDVAKRVNMNRSYFNECFKSIVGSTFNEYLRHLRVEKAKEYLLQSSKPIQWVAEQTGYMDVKYFSQVFREQTGILPSEFRQKGLEGRDMTGALVDK